MIMSDTIASNAPTAASVEQLLQRPLSLGLAAREADMLTAYLAEQAHTPQLHTILLHLSRTGDARHAPVVARYVNYSDDPMVAALALGTLCSEFGLMEKYKEALQQALRGYAWDSAYDVRKRAVTLAGEYLAKHKDAWLATRLVEICNAPKGDFVFESLRDTALVAAALATGLTSTENFRATAGLNAQQKQRYYHDYVLKLSARRQTG